jgi:hypothetical protein
MQTMREDLRDYMAPPWANDEFRRWCSMSPQSFSCIIPSMTHPLSSAWRQPDPSRFLIDDTHVVMSWVDFNSLHEYSASQPSGVYEGKMWRRHNGSFDFEFIARGGKPEWMLCWFSESDKPGYCKTNFRKILLIDGKLPELRP